MANNITLNTGSGGSTLATEQNGSAEHYQKIKITDGTATAFTNSAAVTAGSALKVDNSGVVQPINDNGGSITVDNGGTFAVQATIGAGAAVIGHVIADTGSTTAVTQATGSNLHAVLDAGTAVIGHVIADSGSTTAVTGTVTISGAVTEATLDAALISQEATTSGVKGITAFGAVTTAKPTYTTAKSDALSLDTSGLLRVSLADTPANTNKFLVTPDSVALPANQSVNVNQLAGTTTDTNSGVKSAGTLRVVLATDQPALTNKLLVTPDSVALPANQSVNVNQINAVTPLMGNGTTGTGSQRVTIASDNTAFSVNAVESGTWTVQPGNTANTTPWLVTPSPATSGGLSMFSAVLAASNNLTSVKGSAGMVYGIQAFGTGSAPYWLKLYNKASAPVVASDSALIVKRILVPANATAANGAGVTVPINDMGLAFSTGIAFSCVGLQADADTTNTAAAGAVNIDYK